MKYWQDFWIRLRESFHILFGREEEKQVLEAPEHRVTLWHDLARKYAPEIADMDGVNDKVLQEVMEAVSGIAARRYAKSQDFTDYLTSSSARLEVLDAEIEKVNVVLDAHLDVYLEKESVKTRQEFNRLLGQLHGLERQKSDLLLTRTKLVSHMKTIFTTEVHDRAMMLRLAQVLRGEAVNAYDVGRPAMDDRPIGALDLDRSIVLTLQHVEVTTLYDLLKWSPRELLVRCEPLGFTEMHLAKVEECVREHGHSLKEDVWPFANTE